MSRMPRPLLTLLVLCALAAPLAGCGRGKPLPVLNETIGLKLDEYRLRPQYISAPAGDIRVIVRNRGILTHNIAIQTIPEDPTDRTTVLGRTDTVHPGNRAETHIFLRPGHYRLVCTIANHSYLGQFGELVVE